MAGGPDLEPMWRSGPGDPDYAASARKRVIYTASGPYRTVRGPLCGPGLRGLGPKPCKLHVFGPKPRSPDLLFPLAPRPYTMFSHTFKVPHGSLSFKFGWKVRLRLTCARRRHRQERWPSECVLITQFIYVHINTDIFSYINIV